MSGQSPLYRPRPRRVFDLTPASNESSEPSTPAEPTNFNSELIPPPSVSRTGSIMNLTSPTLVGIYSPTAFQTPRDEYNSPWGTEAEVTPNTGNPELHGKSESDRYALERARLSQGLFRGVILPRALRSALLFAFGIVYGIITVHLHENHWITPVKLENFNHYSWQYLAFWGLAGMALGNVLPWLDLFWGNTVVDNNAKRTKRSSGGSDGKEERTLSWDAAARSVGAFVGIAFAMRRLPWQSTTQASVTLALVNPVLWYSIDRTRTGFCLATVVGLGGMGVLMGLNPEIVPSPAGASAPSASSTATTTFLNGTGEYALVKGLTQESIAVRTWVASVLFCACVCFGNIGRQLALGGAPRDTSLKI